MNKKNIIGLISWLLLFTAYVFFVLYAFMVYDTVQFLDFSRTALTTTHYLRNLLLFVSFYLIGLSCHVLSKKFIRFTQTLLLLTNSFLFFEIISSYIKYRSNIGGIPGIGSGPLYSVTSVVVGISTFVAIALIRKRDFIEKLIAFIYKTKSVNDLTNNFVRNFSWGKNLVLGIVASNIALIVSSILVICFHHLWSLTESPSDYIFYPVIWIFGILGFIFQRFLMLNLFTILTILPTYYVVGKIKSKVLLFLAGLVVGTVANIGWIIWRGRSFQLPDVFTFYECIHTGVLWGTYCGILSSLLSFVKKSDSTA